MLCVLRRKGKANLNSSEWVFPTEGKHAPFNPSLSCLWEKRNAYQLPPKHPPCYYFVSAIFGINAHKFWAHSCHLSPHFLLPGAPPFVKAKVRRRFSENRFCQGPLPWRKTRKKVSFSRFLCPTVCSQWLFSKTVSLLVSPPWRGNMDSWFPISHVSGDMLPFLLLFRVWGILERKQKFGCSCPAWHMCICNMDWVRQAMRVNYVHATCVLMLQWGESTVDECTSLSAVSVLLEVKQCTSFE